MEGHRTPRRSANFEGCLKRASVLECASPLALWLPPNAKPDKLFEIILSCRTGTMGTGWKCGLTARRKTYKILTSVSPVAIRANREANLLHLLVPDYCARSCMLLRLLEILSHTKSNKATIHPDFGVIGRHETVYNSEWQLLRRLMLLRHNDLSR